MIVQFTPPEQSDSFYSKPMHDEFCKLCDQIGIPENKRTEYAEKMGFGFGYVYMCVMQKAIHSGNVSYFLKEADGHLYRYDDALNNAAANVESTVGGAMTHYLVDRGGTVDCWPSPFWPDAFSLNLISKQHERYYNEEDEEWVVKDEKKVSGSFSVPFTYFGSKYVQRVRTEVSTDGSDKYTDATQKTETWRIDQNPGLVYRHHSYVPEKPDEYKSLSRKKHELENQYKEAQRIGAMPKYKAFEKEYFRLMDEWDEFAKAWHNAWFEALNNAQKKN